MGRPTNEEKLEKEAANYHQRMAMMVTIGLQALSQRILTFIALAANVFVFSWALYDPRWERVLLAGLFALTSWCIVNSEKVKIERKVENEP